MTFTFTDSDSPRLVEALSHVVEVCVSNDEHEEVFSIPTL